jgi:hypothetical protein
MKLDNNATGISSGNDLLLTWGMRPEYLHLISKNFSIPISAPNPASVTQNPSYKGRYKVGTVR